MIIQWFDNINKQNTKNSYLLGMQTFTEWVGKTPDELITEAEEESTILMRKRHIIKYLVGFKKYLTEQKLAPLSQKSYLVGVKSFYQFNYIELPKLKSDNAKPLRQNKDIPTKKDIREALKVCDPLEKAAMLVGASSGLSANEIINFQVNDFKKGYDPETEITTLDLRRQKVELDFITFLTQEASRAVIDYLAYRNRTAKTKDATRIRQLKKQNVFSDSDYLFITRKVVDNFLIDFDDEKRKIDRNTFMKLYRDVSEKAQKSALAGNWNLIRSHNIRKYFNSTLLNAGMNFFYVEEMMGHTLPSTQEHYFTASPEKLKEIFLKFVPYLTIQKELDISESIEFKQLKEENRILAAEAIKATVERSELQELRHEVNRLNQLTQIKMISMVDGSEVSVDEYFKQIEEIKNSYMARVSDPPQHFFFSHLA